MSKNTAPLPDWENVLTAAARLQKIIPNAVLVGGTASAMHANHRFSRDADHIIGNLRQQFDEVLQQLESVAGWKTARVQRPVLILGSLDGIETGVRQLIREMPLETIEVEFNGETITLPSDEEILRIKGILILKRNAIRDYLDFVALADHLGDDKLASALQLFDQLYPQSNGQSPLQQLQVQLANPMPFDLDETILAEYKNLDPQWHDWNTVKAICAHVSTVIFDRVCSKKDELFSAIKERIHFIKELKGTAGASYTFYKLAMNSIQNSKEGIDNIDWHKLEEESIRQSILLHKQQPDEVLEVLSKYSPGAVTTERQEFLRLFAQSISKELHLNFVDTPKNITINPFRSS